MVLSFLSSLIHWLQLCVETRNDGAAAIEEPFQRSACCSDQRGKNRNTKKFKFYSTSLTVSSYNVLKLWRSVTPSLFDGFSWNKSVELQCTMLVKIRIRFRNAICRECTEHGDCTSFAHFAVYLWGEFVCGITVSQRVEFIISYLMTKCGPFLALPCAFRAQL